MITHESCATCSWLATLLFLEIDFTCNVNVSINVTGSTGTGSTGTVTASGTVIAATYTVTVASYLGANKYYIDGSLLSIAVLGNLS